MEFTASLLIQCMESLATPLQKGILGHSVQKLARPSLTLVCVLHPKRRVKADGGSTIEDIIYEDFNNIFL
jgi:hypothetical protein